MGVVTSLQFLLTIQVHSPISDTPIQIKVAQVVSQVRSPMSHTPIHVSTPAYPPLSVT